MPKIECQCGRIVTYKAEDAGRTAKCPACATPIELPDPETVPTLDDLPIEGNGSTSTSTGFKLRNDAVPLRKPTPRPDPPPSVLTHPTEAKSVKREVKPAPVEGRPDFWHVLPTAFMYPINKDALPFLLAGAVFLAAVMWIADLVIGLVGAVYYIGIGLQVLFYVILTGYIGGYLMEIVAKSAKGEDEPPDWPSPADFRETAVQPFGYFLAVGILSFGGAVAYYYACRQAPDPTILFLLQAFGCLYMPMGILLVAVHRSPVSLNPWYVVKAMAKAPVRYAVVWVLVVLAVPGMLIALYFVAMYVPFLLLRYAVAFAVEFYFLFVAARMLGLLYYTSWDRLSWIEE